MRGETFDSAKWGRSSVSSVRVFRVYERRKEGRVESESSAVNCRHSYPLFLASLSPPSPDLFFRKTHVFFCAKVHYAPRGGKENPGLTTRRSPLCVSVASRKSSGKLNNVGRDLRESTEHEELSTAGFPTSNDGKIETTPSKDRVRSCETQLRVENTLFYFYFARIAKCTGDPV